jgi:hypothetical protein
MTDPTVTKIETAAKAEVAKAAAWFSGNLYPFLTGVCFAIIAIKVLHLLGLMKGL